MMTGRRAGKRTRIGSSLVELLVALLLLGVGATALAGGMRTALRSDALGRAMAAGGQAVESRLEQLRSRCAPASGSGVAGPVAEHWTIGPRSGPLLESAEVSDSIVMTTGRGNSARVVRSIVRCVR